MRRGGRGGSRDNPTSTAQYQRTVGNFISGACRANARIPAVPFDKIEIGFKLLEENLPIVRVILKKYREDAAVSDLEEAHCLYSLLGWRLREVWDLKEIVIGSLGVDISGLENLTDGERTDLQTLITYMTAKQEQKLAGVGQDDSHNAQMEEHERMSDFMEAYQEYKANGEWPVALFNPSKKNAYGKYVLTSLLTKLKASPVEGYEGNTFDDIIKSLMEIGCPEEAIAGGTGDAEHRTRIITEDGRLSELIILWVLSGAKVKSAEKILRIAKHMNEQTDLGAIEVQVKKWQATYATLVTRELWGEMFSTQKRTFTSPPLVCNARYVFKKILRAAGGKCFAALSPTSGTGAFKYLANIVKMERVGGYSFNAAMASAHVRDDVYSKAESHAIRSLQACAQMTSILFMRGNLWYNLGRQANTVTPHLMDEVFLRDPHIGQVLDTLRDPCRYMSVRRMTEAILKGLDGKTIGQGESDSMITRTDMRAAQTTWTFVQPNSGGL